MLVQIILGRIKAHLHAHQAFADQVGLAGFLHADCHIGLAHGQVQHPFFQHQIDFQMRVLFIKLGQARCQPQGAKAGGGGHTQFAKHTFFAVANTGRGAFQPFGHGLGGLEQQLPLFGQDQTARVAMEQGGIEAFLKSL